MVSLKFCVVPAVTWVASSISAHDDGIRSASVSPYVIPIKILFIIRFRPLKCVLLLFLDCPAVRKPAWIHILFAQGGVGWMQMSTRGMHDVTHTPAHVSCVDWIPSDRLLLHSEIFVTCVLLLREYYIIQARALVWISMFKSACIVVPEEFLLL